MEKKTETTIQYVGVLCGNYMYIHIYIYLHLND